MHVYVPLRTPCAMATATSSTAAFATCVTVNLHKLIAIFSSTVYSNALVGIGVSSQQTQDDGCQSIMHIIYACLAPGHPLAVILVQHTINDGPSPQEAHRA
jgi:hypothetical protein